MRKRKKLESLTMKDNFMFGAVMSDPGNCKPFLEMALGFPIGKLTVSTEKNLVYHPEYRGVRLDIEAKDEKRTHYNVEMQVARKPHLARRARYYRSQLDMELLDPNQEYGNLPDTYVIFICDFDPFGLGRYRYTFRNLCLEEPGFTLKDGQTVMFLNTRGRNGEDVPERLVRFLKYIGSDLPESQKDFRDGYVKQLQTAVREVKANREMEVMYMTLQELMRDEHEAGKLEGKAEGKAEFVLDLLQDLPGSLPKKIRKRIFSETNNEVLRKYLRLAVSSGSVEEFMQRMQVIVATEIDGQRAGTIRWFVVRATHCSSLAAPCVPSCRITPGL